ncbi:unannotated protein [freshwater metagenome]|uniref:Unannotated protein n=1 Tax=freshwater metagenome TaxID=449393 RepID=A0A6J6DSS0_9ZZZZ
MARRDATAIGRNLEPVAISSRATETNLVAAVGSDIHLGVIQNTRGVRGIRTIGRARFHRERGVNRASDIAANDVFVARSNWCFEIDSVGVVAGERTGRRHDAVEHGALRIELLVRIQRALENVGEVAETLGDIVIAHDRSRHDPFIAGLLKQCH